jgi:hypothetical protein
LPGFSSAPTLAGSWSGFLRIEDMHAFGIEPEFGLAARADSAGGIEGGDQLGAHLLAVELTLELLQLIGDLRRRS